MQLDVNKIYSLNSDYILRHDKRRTFILSYNRQKNDSSKYWQSIIHPAQAAILSFFTHGKKLKEVLIDLSSFLDMPKEEITKIIKPYIQNNEEFHTEFEGENFNFPKNMIIESNQKTKEYNTEDFDYEELDFKKVRFYSGPSQITIMLTNQCATKCIYCYADIEHKVEQKLSLARIKSIIDEAYQLNCRSVDIMGGEIMIYLYWKELIEYLIDYNYYPSIISTKIPVKENDIRFLKEKGINNLQISLDSANSKIIEQTIRRFDTYLKKMEATLSYCTKHSINVQIAVTLTNFNANYIEVKRLLDYLANYVCIKKLSFRAAFYSLYRDGDNNFEKWGIDKQSYQKLNENIENIKQNYSFEIIFDLSPLKKLLYSDEGGSSEFKGAACSANNTHLFILPDGKATICEQLYWTEEFIVGDLNTQTLTEVWNSTRSMQFAHLKQENFPDDSACSSCGIFDECHENVNKCWADIIKAYGKDKWYYPDPRCAYAPKTFNKIGFDHTTNINTKKLML